VQEGNTVKGIGKARNRLSDRAVLVHKRSGGATNSVCRPDAVRNGAAAEVLSARKEVADLFAGGYTRTGAMADSGVRMFELAPPSRPPRVGIADRPYGNLQSRLRLILYTSVTVFLTAWFCTMGPVPAVLSLVVAKHVLVAILVMGLGVDRARRQAV